jgi:MoaA/NifB/PqqE/SkfB family radical SAM enzyme
LYLSLFRSGSLMSWRCERDSLSDEVTLREIVHAANGAAERAGAFLVCGGEPLARRDLAELVAQLARMRPHGLGLYTAGHALTASAAERLRALGVHRLHVPYHCARQDAHDWLVGQPGALKMTHRAIRTALAANLAVTADVMLTRPTAAHLAETIEVLARTGVRTINVRRLTAADTRGTEFVSLSPRLDLLEEHLEAAAAVALARRVRLSLRDLPVCAAPRLRRLFAAADSERWLMPDGSVHARAEAANGCVECPGRPDCAGAPHDYVTRFGWEEFTDPVAAVVRVAEQVADQQREHPAPPMSFTWRGPHRVRCEACGDDGYERASTQPPFEPTRVIRARLVEAARHRPSLLRLVGANLLAHPQAAALIYDALRLFRGVVVAGEASRIVDWSDLDLRRMKDLRGLDVALYGPDAATHDAHCGIPGAFAATLRGVERLRGETRIRVGAYALVHDARSIAAFADAWQRGALPGAPRFRLSARGGSLDELVECARALPGGPARSALLAVLPHCLCESAGLGDEIAAAAVEPTAPQQTVHCGRSMPYRPCGSDPMGEFETCNSGTVLCALPGCPGNAMGWHREARTERWSGSI